MIGKIDNQYLEAAKYGNMAVVTFRGHVYELITSLEESQVMMDFLREAEQDPAIQGLLLLSQNDCLGEAPYEQFIRSILKEDQSAGNRDVPDFLQKNTRFRQIIILNKFIRYLAGYHKLVIVGIDSTIVTPFMGVTLVADLRVASPGGSFSLAHRKYGLHPTGAIPYLLTHYLGHSKAIEVQLSDRVTAEEAFRMGLISQILPADGFRENCLRYAKPFIKHCRSTLQMTKRLNNFKHRGLEDYFVHESNLMNL